MLKYPHFLVKIELKIPLHLLQSTFEFELVWDLKSLILNISGDVINGVIKNIVMFRT